MTYDLPNGAILRVTFSNVNFTPVHNSFPASSNKTRGYQPWDMMTTPGNVSSGHVWSRGALQYGYFIPGKEILFSNIGPGPSNEPGEDAQEISFDITYSLEINGVQVPAEIVFSDGETANLNGETTATATMSNTGTYTVVVTDSKDCTTSCEVTMEQDPNCCFTIKYNGFLPSYGKGN